MAGPPVFVKASTTNFNVSATSASISMDIPAYTGNSIYVVSVCQRGGSSAGVASLMSLSGSGLTRIGAYHPSTGTSHMLELWYIENPGIGLSTCDAEFPVSNWISGGSVLYEQTKASPVGTVQETSWTELSAAFDYTASAMDTNDVLVSWAGEYVSETFTVSTDAVRGLMVTGYAPVAGAYAATAGDSYYVWTKGSSTYAGILAGFRLSGVALPQQSLAGAISFAGALANYFRIQQQDASGTLTLSGAISDFKLALSRFLAGTLALSGAFNRKLSLFRNYVGTLALSGAIAQIYRIQQALISGVLVLSGAVSDMKLSLTRFLAGTLPFSSLLRGKVPKFVVGAVNLVLKPIAVVRTWLSPDADTRIN